MCIFDDQTEYDGWVDAYLAYIEDSQPTELPDKVPEHYKSINE